MMTVASQPKVNVAVLMPPVTSLGDLGKCDEPVARSRALSKSSLARLSGAAVALCLNNSLHSRWNTYVEQHRRFQEQFSVESVHELRVASRRLMAHCDLLKSVVPCAASEKARRTLKRRFKTLGDLRDVHVQLQFVTEHLDDFPELILFRDVLARRERRLAKTVIARLRGFKLHKLESRITAMSEAVAEQAADPIRRDHLVSKILGVAGSAYADVVRSQRQICLQNLGTIHRTRIRFKKFRYVIEALSPDITGFGRRELRALAGYQRRMGTIHDLEILDTCLDHLPRKHGMVGELMEPFQKYLRQRRTRAVWRFAQVSDRLFEFWPSSWQAPAGCDAHARAA